MNSEPSKERNGGHGGEGGHGDGHERDHHLVDVSISTTAGFFPAEGFNRVPVNQKVEIELRKAMEALKIKDTAGWVASVITAAGKRPVDPAKTYAENGLSGEIEIDWGPSEGGGG